MRREWVISRGACLYRALVLSDIPPGERMGALALRVQQWSPFDETGRYVVWRGEVAQVWIWDEAQRRELALQAGTRVARVVPETLLRPPPPGDTVRLLDSLEGKEAQVWTQGRLIASHWWSDEPSAAHWARFQLANNHRPAELPVAESTRLLDRPWARNAGRAYSINGGNGWLGGYAVLLLFAVAVSWQSVAVWRWWQAREGLRQQLVTLTHEAEPIAAARAEAIDHRQVVAQLAALERMPTQLELLAAVASRLPRSVRLTQWSYAEDKLTFTLENQRLDARYYVKAYEEQPIFRAVTAQRGRQANQLVVGMEVLPEGPSQ